MLLDENKTGSSLFLSGSVQPLGMRSSTAL